MAISAFEIRLSSKFQCETPQSAAPLQKRSNLLGDVHDARAPHCCVSVKIGPQGTYAERINANFYQGHVPDAPVLIGKAQSQAYADGIAAVSWGRNKAAFVMLAGAAGSMAGAMAGAAFLAVYAAAVAVFAAGSIPLLTTASSVHVLALFTAVGACILGMYEATDWANAKLDLEALKELSDLGNMIIENTALPDDKVRIRPAAEKGFSDTRWLIQQAAFELEGLAKSADEKKMKELQELQRGSQWVGKEEKLPGPLNIAA